jgi:tRNA(adenine34) deaminase
MTTGYLAQFEPAMRLALAQAVLASEAGADVPVGAVLLDPGGAVIGRGRNRREADADPTAHAEILALREAARQRGSWRLDGCTLVVTLEPCTMCAGAISFARIRRLYYGAADPKGGAVESGVRFFASPTCHHTPDIYPGIGEHASATLLKEFFRERR